MSPFMAGMLFVLWSIGFSAGSFTATVLLRAYGAVLVLAVLSCVTAVLSLLQFATIYAGHFFALYLALGLCGGSIFTASHTLFGDLFAERRSSALAVLDVVFSIGNMAAPLAIVALLHRQMQWQTFYLVLAIGFSAVGILFFWQFTQRRFAERSARSATTIEKTEAGHGAPPFAEVAVLAIASFSLGTVEWTQNVWFVTYAIEGGMGPDLARFCISVFTAGMIVSRLSIILFDEGVQSARAQWAMLFLALSGEALVVMGKTVPSMLIGNFLLGSGIGGLFPIFLGRAMDRNPASSATLSMLMVVSLTLGGQLASFTLGALADRFGVTAAFSATIPMITIMCLTFGIYRRM